MKTIKAIVIDDEKLARDLIKNYLADFPNIEVLTECSDGFEGIKAIQTHKPDLVFLDVQMPKITGFELLELMEEPPIIIFSTAYNEYALKAFEMNAVDYLLKPYSKDRFKKAIEKAEEKLQSKSSDQTAIKELSATPPEESLERIVVKTGSKIKVIPIETVLYLEAQDDYVMLYTSEGKFLKQQTMKFFEQSLPPNQFIRIHRSYIVNVEQMVQMENYEKDTYRVVLKNTAKLPVSRSGYGLLKKILKF
jgi:two-component system LytT family response regulator